MSECASGFSPHSEAVGIKPFVAARIAEMEQEYGFRVLFVLEKSSHTWGTARKDGGSDWDVHFVFAYPLARYLSSVRPNETEKKDCGPRGGGEDDSGGLDCEIVGRDVRSMAQLALKNDVTVLECVLSPFVYSGLDSPALTGLRAFVEEHYCWEKLAQYYYGWAKNHFCLLKSDPQKPGGKKKWREANKFEHKTLKVYGYVLRGIFKCQWICSHKTLVGLPVNVHSLYEWTSTQQRSGGCKMPAVVGDSLRKLNTDRSMPAEAELADLHAYLDAAFVDLDAVLPKVEGRASDKSMAAIDGRQISTEKVEAIDAWICSLVEFQGLPIGMAENDTPAPPVCAATKSGRSASYIPGLTTCVVAGVCLGLTAYIYQMADLGSAAGELE